MLLFHGISLSKLTCFLKCFRDIVAKFFPNIWINIVKQIYNLFRFVQVYEFGGLGFYFLEKNVFLNCHINFILYFIQWAKLAYPKILRNFTTTTRGKGQSKSPSMQNSYHATVILLSHCKCLELSDRRH